MNRRKLLTAAAVLSFSLAAQIASAASATLLDVQEMVNEAVAYFKTHGAEATIAAVNEGGPFLQGELYVFIIGPDGKNAANAADTSNLGKDARLIRDPDGKYYGREILDLATPEGAWVEYKRHNPSNGTIQRKISWVRKIGGYVIGSGLYLKD